MNKLEMAEIEFGTGRNCLTAWVGGKYLASCIPTVKAFISFFIKGCSELPVAGHGHYPLLMTL